MGHRRWSVGISVLLYLLAEIALSAEAAPAAAETIPPAPGPPAVGNAADTEQPAPGNAADQAGAASDYPADEDRLDGDHLKLRVNVEGFKAIDGPDKGQERCAPKGSKIVVTKHKEDELLVRFKLAKAAQAANAANAAKDLQDPGFFSTEEAASAAALGDCQGRIVNDHTQYSINAATLSDHSYRRTGVMFGALVVPFKFHLGGSRKLSASSTVAPYVGFRGPAPFGLTFTPVVSAGLGLVPVNNPDTDQTDTKSAFSAAVGVLLTHSKNDKFNAGVLFGKDFLSKADRAADETAGKVWFSLYAGYKL